MIDCRRMPSDGNGSLTIAGTCRPRARGPCPAHLAGRRRWRYRQL